MGVFSSESSALSLELSFDRAELIIWVGDIPRCYVWNSSRALLSESYGSLVAPRGKRVPRPPSNSLMHGIVSNRTNGLGVQAQKKCISVTYSTSRRSNARKRPPPLGDGNLRPDSPGFRSPSRTVAATDFCNNVSFDFQTPHLALATGYTNCTHFFPFQRVVHTARPCSSHAANLVGSRKA